MESVALPTALKSRERLMFRQVFVVAAIHSAALVALVFPSWEGFGLLIIGHFITGCLGGSIGLHRMLSHKSFIAHPVLRGALALCGTLSLMGGPITWAAFHRSHHSKQDETGDPHSALRGFWWSHMGWVFFSAPNRFMLIKNRKLVSDLTSSRWLRLLENYNLAINAFAMIIGFALIRRWDVFLWAFPLRIVVLWHCTWLVNSYAHGAHLESKDGETHPRNSAWLAILTYGEGYHKNHHLRPADPRFAQKNYQPDMGYWCVRFFRAVKLAESREDKKPSVRLAG